MYNFNINMDHLDISLDIDPNSKTIYDNWIGELTAHMEVFKTSTDDFILETLTKYHPCILLYYKKMNEDFNQYFEKIPIEFFNFNIDEECCKIINIFVKSHKARNIYNSIIIHFIKFNDISNINILYQKYDCLDFIVEALIVSNNPELLELFLSMNLYNQNGIELMADVFFTSNSLIFNRTDKVHICQVLHNYFQNNSASQEDYHVNTILNTALVYGRENSMHFALNNGGTFSQDDMHQNITPDTMFYAIVGGNINCIKTIYETFKEHIEDRNILQYINFASIFGTPEIIEYILTFKPHITDQIDKRKFFNSILMYSLCNLNTQIMEYALRNGAVYKDGYLEYIKKFNSIYDRTFEDESLGFLLEDKYDFWFVFCRLPEDYNTKLPEFIETIINLSVIYGH